MTVLPTEIEYMIIAFNPASSLKLVCKIWNKEVNSIHKKSANIIGSWYSKRKCPEWDDEIYTDIKKVIRFLISRLTYSYFIRLPEFLVTYHDLNPDLLSVIPNIENRNKEDVKNVLLNFPIDIDEWYTLYWGYRFRLSY